MKNATLIGALMLCMLTAAIQSTTAQTVLISPTGDGGFETGTTFAANGWTVVNSGSGNQWFCSTFTFTAGARSAYISNNASGTNNNYTNFGFSSASRVQHFYRNVTFPAGETAITFSFKWRCNGESGHDDIKIFLVSTGTTPVAGTALPSANLIAGAYDGQSNYQTVTMALNPALAGTTQRLVFSWRNDNNLSGNNPAGSFDEISLTSCAPPTITASNDGPVCAGSALNLSATSNGTSFSWSGPNSFSSTLQNPSIGSSTTAATGTYTVTATLSGCTASNTTSATVNAATAINTQPTAQSSCAGLNATFSLVAVGSSVTYQWQDNSSGSMANIGGATNTSYTASGVTTGMNGRLYSCIVSGLCGVVNSNSVALTVNTSPTVAVSSNPVNALICGTGSVTLTATGASSYSWSPGGATGSSIAVSPLTTTNYTVTGTASGCQGTASQNVTVNPAVTAFASASITTLCAGNNSALASSGGNSSDYTMSSIAYSAPLGSGAVAISGDDAVAAVALPFTFSYYGVSYNNINVYTNGFVQLGTSSGSTGVYGQTIPSVTNPNSIIAGVWSDLNSLNNITTFTTGSAPNRIFTIYYNNVQFYCFLCSGSKRGNTNFQIRLYEKSNIVEVLVHDVSNNSTSGTNKTLGLENANGTAAKVPAGRNGNSGDWMVSTPEAWRFTPSGGPITYSWSPATYLTDPTDTNPTAQNMQLSQNYVVTITDLNGCTASAAAPSITVNPLPNVTVTPGGPTAFCNGNTVTLTASAGLSSYSWNTIPVQTSQSIVVNAAANYTVTGTNANNCSNTASQAIVVYDTLPANIFVIGFANLCTGQTSDLQAVQANAVSYVWNTTEPTSLITVGAAGTYSVTATDIHGCLHHQSQVITESPAPAAPVIVANGSTVLCFDGVSTTTVGLQTTNYSSNLLWSSGETTTNINADYADNFFVTYTDANGCFSSSNVIPVIVKTTSTDPVAAETNVVNNTLCAGSGTTLSVQGGSLGDDAVWTWYEGSCSGTALATGSSLLVNPAATTSYFVRAEGPCNITNCVSVTVVVNTFSVDPLTASPSAAILCGSGNSSLSVNGGSLGTGADWVWYAGGCANGASVGTGATLNVAPTVTTDYYVRAEGDCNITNCVQTTVTVKSISVDPVLATNSALYNEICIGNPVQLTVTGGSLGSDADWVWYEGNCASGLPVATGASVSVTPAVGGNHTYYVRAEGYCNNTNCVNGSVFVRTAGPSSTVSTLNAPATACNGSAGAVSINNVSNATFYSWSGPSGVLFDGNPGPYQTLSTNVATTFGTLPGGTSGYSLCVFAGNACGQSNTICRWVRGKVSAPLAITGSSTGCPNSSFPYSVAPVAGADTYTWTVVGNDATLNGTALITITTTTPNVNVDFAAPFTGATLQVYASLNCGYSSAAKALVITRNPSTPGTMSGLSYVCPAASTSYSVSPVNGATTYTWTSSVAGAVITPSGNTASIFFPTVVSGGSSVCVTAVSACGYSSTTRCKGIASGLPNTPANITGPAAGQCGATGVSFSIPPVSSAASYSWTVSNGNAAIVGPANLSSVTVDFTGSLNSVQLTVSAANNCGNGGSRTVTIFGKPGSPAAITGNNSVCNGSVESYMTTGSAGASLLTWTVPATATILGGQGSNNLLVQWGSGGGQLKVSASNSCGSSAITILPITVTCRQSQLANTFTSDVKVYPNPAHDKMKVEISSYTSDRTTIELSNALGEIVYRSEFNIHEGNNLMELNLENLPKGFYNLSVQGTSVNSKNRVVIQ